MSVTENIEDLTIAVSWNVEQINLNLSRYQLLIKEDNHFYFYTGIQTFYSFKWNIWYKGCLIEKSTDYEDLNETSETLNYIDQCYISCFKDPKCVAYTWNDESNLCKYKYTTANPKPCNQIDCFRIPGLN